MTMRQVLRQFPSKLTFQLLVVGLMAALVFLGGCASIPTGTETASAPAPFPGARPGEVDLRNHGSVGEATGLSTPLALASRAAQVACSTGWFGFGCYQAMGALNSARGL